MKKCPYCAELIQDEAVKCKFCGEMLDKTVASVTPKNAQQQVPENETYGLSKPLSIWNFGRIKNPENFGGFKRGTLTLYTLLGLMFWPITLIFYIQAQGSGSKLKKVQSSNFLIATIIGAVWTISVIAGAR